MNVAQNQTFHTGARLGKMQNDFLAASKRECSRTLLLVINYRDERQRETGAAARYVSRSAP